MAIRCDKKLPRKSAIWATSLRRAIRSSQMPSGGSHRRCRVGCWDFCGLLGIVVGSVINLLDTLSNLVSMFVLCIVSFFCALWNYLRLGASDLPDPRLTSLGDVGEAVS